MIDENLVKQCGVYVANDEPLKVELSRELLSSYIALIEQNAELHKELVKYKSGNSYVMGSVPCELPPSDLAM